ncbi:hypothetical protein AgCh_011899 [Apium graveolens]
MLKKVDSPMFKVCEVNFSEEESIIKKELRMKTMRRKMQKQLQLSKMKRSPCDEKLPEAESRPQRSKKWVYIKKGKCTTGQKKKVIWIIDSGCSRHMTGDMALLSQFEEKVSPLVTSGDRNKGFTMGYGKLISENIVIDDVALVAGLNVNLLSVHQFADKANEEGICCFYTKASVEQSKLWHKKPSHLNFKAINTLVKKELVRDMPNLEFAQDEVYDACQKGKNEKIKSQE